MCYYTRQSKEAVELEKRFQAKIYDMAEFYQAEQINGFAHQKTPVITNENKSAIQFFHWGLIPFWAKDNSIRKNTLNAKIETIKEKPAFRSVVKNRCLVIADGFYEWQWLDDKGKRKQKYLITLPDNGLFTLAGIWSDWTDKATGEIFQTYSIVTTAANNFMSEIHNSKKRMPVILHPELEKEWLAGADTDPFKNCEMELKAVAV